MCPFHLFQIGEIMKAPLLDGSHFNIVININDTCFNANIDGGHYYHVMITLMKIITMI